MYRLNVPQILVKLCKLVQQYKPQFVLKEGNLYKKQNRIEIHSFKFKKPLCV